MIEQYMMCPLLAAKAPELMRTEAHHGRMENETPEACIRSAGLFLPGKEQRKKKSLRVGNHFRVDQIPNKLARLVHLCGVLC